MTVCESCGTEGAVPTHYGDDLCPTCATRHALAYAASDHLKHLMKNALSQWLDTWKGHAHVIRHADDESGIIAQMVMEDLLAEVQAAPVKKNIKLKKTA